MNHMCGKFTTTMQNLNSAGNVLQKIQCKLTGAWPRLVELVACKKNEISG